MSTVLSPREAAAVVPSGSTVAVGGSGSLLQVPETMLAVLEERFLVDGDLSDLQVVHTMGLGDRDKRGLNHLAHAGLVRRFIGSHFVLSPAQQDLIANNAVEAVALPAGTITLLYREIAAGRPGLLTHVGLDTFIDPRQQWGRLNERTLEGLGELVELGGRSWLYYPTFPIDVALIRATTADERGNLSMEDEGGLSDNLAIAQAAHNSGGVVIAEVKRVVAAGSIPAQSVRVPAALVDHIVLTDFPWQTPLTRHDPFRSGQLRAAAISIPVLPLTERKIIARRALAELSAGDVVNIGFGLSNGVSYVAAEERLLGDLVLTVEQGLFGGVPGVDLDSGTALNPDAFIDLTAQFDFYDGGGLDIACVAMGQVDSHGNVNVSHLGGRPIGPGGFIDITQNTRRVVFCGTLTGGGLDVEVGDGGVRVLREGRYPKFVQDVDQITFSGPRASAAGHEVLYVTERAVFALRDGVLVLEEVAPGLDAEADVLAHMEFRPRVSATLRTMDPRIFHDRLMGPE